MSAQRRSVRTGLMGRRGVVLLAALIVITMGALVGSTAIYYSQAEAGAAEVSLRRAQARAMAWSGVQAIMAELASQRDGLLKGEAPTITDRWSSAADGDSIRWGFRVVPADGAGERAAPVSESGKLCINTATQEMLVTAGVPAAIATRIIAARANRPFASTEELLGVEGVTEAMMYGGAPGDEPAEATEAPAETPLSPVPEGASAAGAGIENKFSMSEFSLDPKPPADAGASRPDVGSAPGSVASNSVSLARLPLARVLTVFSFDPDVQIGFGPKASEGAGKRRINLNTKWSDGLGDAIEGRFDKDVADAVKSIMERGEKFGAVSDIVKKLRAFNVQIERWPEMLDAFSTSPDEYRAGAVDLGTAPAKVLAAIPGISEDAATEIEFRRERLDQEKRSTIAWPLLEGILTQEQFEKACDFLTARSMQWRVIIEGGVETAGAGNDSADSSPGGSAGLGASVQSERGSGAIFRDRIVLEAVIDVSSKRAHIAYLRDITHLRTAKQLASRAARPTPTDRRAGSEESAVPVANPKSSVTQPPTLNTLEMPGGLDFGGLDVGSMKGTELNSGTLDFGSAPGRADGPTPNPVDATSGAPPVDPQEEPPARDPRLGRWTTGRGGKP